MGTSDGLRYRALIESIWSLQGTDHFQAIRPHVSGLVYRAHDRPGIPPLADVYLPERPTTRASIVLVHGGAFVIGSRAMKPMRFLAARFVAEGIAVCSIDYRLAFRGGRLDEGIDDVLAAVEFWRTRAPSYGLDPARISLVGLSAGATLSWLAASRAAEGTLHRLVSVFGLYELDHLRGPLSTLLPRVIFSTGDRADWHARSPRGVPSPSMPTLLLHGTEDGLVPVEQARRLAAHRASLGLPTKLAIYERAPHGFFNFPCEAGESAAKEIADYVR